MKQNLQFKATQHLSLTPQLQQSIKLLQMSSVELNQELEILIQQNPLIEMIEEEDEEENKNTSPISQEETSFEISNHQESQEPIYEHEINWDDEYTKDNYVDSTEYQEPVSQTLKQYLEDIFHLIPISEKDQAIISNMTNT